MRIGNQRGRRNGNVAYNANRQPKRDDTKRFSRKGHYTMRAGGPGRPPWHWKTPGPIECWDFSGNEGWVQAPGGSHLERFRFVYGLDGPWAARGDLLGRGEIKFFREEAISYLQIEFKERDGKAVFWSIPGTQYAADRLETIYWMMESAEHPGELIWSHLVGEGGTVAWPYDTNV